MRVEKQQSDHFQSRQGGHVDSNVTSNNNARRDHVRLATPSRAYGGLAVLSEALPARLRGKFQLIVQPATLLLGSALRAPNVSFSAAAGKRVLKTPLSIPAAYQTTTVAPLERSTCSGGEQ